MPATTMEVRLSRWRETFRFSNNPFELFNADHERDFLPFCFVDRPYLHNVLGDPAHPQMAFLSARTGEGKSATREMVVYECQSGTLHGKALPVCYDSFEHLRAAHDDPAQVTLRDHVSAIARLLFKTIQTVVPAASLEQLQEYDAELLLGMANTYASSASMFWLRRALPRVSPLSGVAEGMTPAETLLLLADLVSRMGPSPDASYQAVYILIDRADEIFTNDPQAGLRALAPLIRENALINRPHLAFKFFLPDTYIPGARALLPIAPEKVVMESIIWDPSLLMDVINQRLSFFSQGAVDKYEQIFATELRGKSVVTELVERSGGSPRALIHLFHQMVLCHVERGAKTSLLERIDLKDALILLDHRNVVERHVPVAPLTIQTGLLIDESGHVWVDGKLLTGDFSVQEKALLRVLDRRKPNIVSREELIRAVWPEEAAAGVDDDTNLRKLVDRLRKKLAFLSGVDKDRYIRNARGHGYWLSE